MAEEVFYTSDGRIYRGMDQKTVQGLLDDLGLTCTFISEDDFNALQAAALKLPPPQKIADVTWVTAKQKAISTGNLVDALTVVGKQLGLEP